MASSTQTYKDHTLTLTIIKVGATSSGSVKSVGPLVNKTISAGSNLTDAQVGPAMASALSQMKSDIDAAATNTGSTTSSSISSWYLSSWLIDGNGGWTNQPILTVNGQNFTYDSPQGYIDKLNWIKDNGGPNPSTLNTYITQLEGAQTTWGTTAPADEDIATNTIVYNGHELKVTIIKSGPNDSRGEVACTGPLVNMEHYTGSGMTDSAVGTAVQGIIQNMKDAIDAASASAGTGDTGDTGDTGARVVQNSMTYNEHNIEYGVVASGTGFKRKTVTSGPVVNETDESSNTRSTNNNTYMFSALQAKLQDLKTLIDGGGTTGTGTGDVSETGDETDPRPDIVWEVEGLTESYQAWRNDLVATNIASGMRGQTYDSEYAIREAFNSAFRAQVGAQAANLNFDNGGVNLPGDWYNTYRRITEATQAKLGISSWAQGVNVELGTTTGTTTGTDTGTTTGTGVDVGGDVGVTLDDLENKANEINAFLKDTMDMNISEWQTRLANLPDMGEGITTRLSELSQSFLAAAENLKAAGDLEKKAQAIYSNDNIRNMREQLISKGFDVGKAGPAVFFKAMKDRATLSAEIYKIQAQQEKELAQLETTKAQLSDQIRAAGMEADKWMFDSVNNITKQIQSIRDNYDLAKATNIQNYVMKPLLDIFSGQRQAELQNVISRYETQYLNANPSEKLVAAAKIFGSDWAFADSRVLSYVNEPWGVFLTSVASILRENKQNYEVDVAGATTGDVTNINTQLPIL